MQNKGNNAELKIKNAQKLLRKRGAVLKSFLEKITKLTVLFFRSKATRADVRIRDSAFTVYSFYLMNVGFPVSSGLYITVADVVAAHLTLSTNTANSAHYDTSYE